MKLKKMLKINWTYLFFGGPSLLLIIVLSDNRTLMGGNNFAFFFFAMCLVLVIDLVNVTILYNVNFQKNEWIKLKRTHHMKVYIRKDLFERKDLKNNMSQNFFNMEKYLLSQKKHKQLDKFKFFFWGRINEKEEI